MLASDPSVPYKQFHENYISNNNGTTAVEVFVAIATVPTFAYFHSLLTFIPVGIFGNYRSFRLSSILCEFGIIVIPTIMTLTILSDYLLLVLVGTLLCFLVIFSVPLVKLKFKHRSFSKVYNASVKVSKCPSVTFLRAVTNIITAVCILAVDFKIFPVRFSKTETFGFSLMDTGVGIYVFVNALVAPEARNAANHISFYKACISSLPLIVLGMARLLATEMFNYQQHVSEYGVHWNFFLTLAFTKIISSLLVCVFPYAKSFPILSLASILFYEVCLYFGMGQWLLGDTARTDFLTSNREGIFSLFGYTAIYFSGVSLGQVIFKEKSISLKNSIKLLISLIGLGCLFWTGAYLSFVTVGVSRRLANLGYCLWVTGLTVNCLGLSVLGQVISLFLYVPFGQGKEVKPVLPYLFRAINCHGLLFFLLANLLTGFVNLSIKTLYVGPVESFLILLLYMSICCGVTCVYHSKKNCKIMD